jgi:hypothetical protein
VREAGEAGGVNQQQRDEAQEEQGHHEGTADRNKPAVIKKGPSLYLTNISRLEKPRIIISIDFGTTFSSVAYVSLPVGAPPGEVILQQVHLIGGYQGYEPPLGVHNTHEVPTEIWYDDGSAEKSKELISHEDENAHPDDDGQSDTSSSDDESAGSSSAHEEGDVKQYWGYEVRQMLNISDIHRDDAAPLTRFKTYVQRNEQTEHDHRTEPLKTRIRTILETLKNKDIIQEDTDIYRDYFRHLLKHTKVELTKTGDLHPNMLLQFVVCVPEQWPAVARKFLQTAVEKAVVAVNFGEHAHQRDFDVSMISEPDAAAAYILADPNSMLSVDIAS